MQDLQRGATIIGGGGGGGGYARVVRGMLPLKKNF